MTSHAELLAPAEKATPGKWVVCEKTKGTEWPIYAGDKYTIVAIALGAAEMDFIAAANPATVKALVERVMELEKKVQSLTDELDDLKNDVYYDGIERDLLS